MSIDLLVYIFCELSSLLALVCFVSFAFKTDSKFYYIIQQLYFTLSKLPISLLGGWSILKMLSPRRMSASCFFRASIWARIWLMFSRASAVCIPLVNGPLLVNSSKRLCTCFLNSSDWPSKLLLNFSCWHERERVKNILPAPQGIHELVNTLKHLRSRQRVKLILRVNAILRVLSDVE